MADFQMTPELIDNLEKSKAISSETASQLRAKFQTSQEPVQPQVTPPDLTQIPQDQIQNQSLQQEPKPLSKISDSTILNWMYGINPESNTSATQQIVEQSRNQAPVDSTDRTINATDDQTSTLTPDDFVPVPEDANPQVQTNPLDVLVDPLNQGVEQQKQGLIAAANAGAQQGAAEAARLKELNEQLKKQDEINQQREEERKQEFAKAEAEYNDVITKLQESKIDPKRYWSRKSTGEKILATIGLILGGIGGGLQGTGRNAALEVLNREIEADIEAQKADIEKLKGMASGKQNLLSIMRQRFGDEKQAESAARLAGLQLAELDIKRIASQSNSEKIKANAQVALGQLETLKVEKLAEFYKAVQSKSSGIKIRSGDILPPDFDIEQLDPDQRKRYVPGMGVATTLKGKEAVSEMKAAVDEVNSGVNELLKFTERSLDSVNPFERARAGTIAATLVGALRLPIVGPGAMSDQERELLQTIIANPTKIFSLDMSSRARLQTLKERMNQKLLSLAKAHIPNYGEPKALTFKPAK